LGFNQLEAAIYLTLVQNNRMTGYKVAKTLAKPAANTYKALASLQKKGAVLCDSSDSTKQFEAVPIKEFLNQREAEFREQRKIIEAEIQSLEQTEQKAGIYQLKSREFALEKAKTMIEAAESVLLLDIFPQPLNALETVLNNRAAAPQAPEMWIKTYRKNPRLAAPAFVAFNGEQIIENSAGQWLILVKDISEALAVCFPKNQGDITHGVWIKDPFLAYVLYNGSANEFSFIEILNHVYQNETVSRDDIINIHQQCKKYFQLQNSTERKSFAQEENLQ